MLETRSVLVFNLFDKIKLKYLWILSKGIFCLEQVGKIVCQSGHIKSSLKKEFNMMVCNFVGVERERFMISPSDKLVVSGIGRLLPAVWKITRGRGLPEDIFIYELFAGQIEDRTRPCDSLEGLRQALLVNDEILKEASDLEGLLLDSSEFMEEKRFLSLKVNPFDARHQLIWQNISAEQKLSASQVAAVHIHLSAEVDIALKVLNNCRESVVNKLIALGDHSDGRRINAYCKMAGTSGIPPFFSDAENLLRYIKEKGGEKNVWDLVRYKPSTGTVEFRMFGATDDMEEVIEYVRACMRVVLSVR